MSEKMLTSAFLTRGVAEMAVHHVLCVIQNLDGVLLNRMMCHFVVLVQSMKDDRDRNYPDWPNYQIEPCALYEYSLGDPANWPRKFDEIARCEALQLWHERNDDRTDCMPHLLFPGDTPCWGGVKRHGVVVTCSGFQPHFNKMFSGMVADMCIGLSYDAWDRIKDKFGKNRGTFQESFLP